MLHTQQLHPQLDVRAMLIILPHTAQSTEVIVTLGALSAMDQTQTSVNSASTMQSTYRVPDVLVLQTTQENYAILLIKLCVMQSAIFALDRTLMNAMSV
jgi:hypothetical protein